MYVLLGGQRPWYVHAVSVCLGNQKPWYMCSRGVGGGPALGPVLKSLHLGAKGGGPDSGVPPGRHSKGGGHH